MIQRIIPGIVPSSFFLKKQKKNKTSFLIVVNIYHENYLEQQFQMI